MFGKHYDNRVHPHFVHTYTRVPYLDSQIFDLETHALKLSRKTKIRTDKATEGIERAKQKSEQLSNALRNSRVKREEEDKDFISNLETSQRNCLDKERKSWVQFSTERSLNKSNYLSDQAYLDQILKSNSTKAASRLISVRRWE